MNETFWNDGTSQTVERYGDNSFVISETGYNTGAASCVLQDTGNGYIAHFPSDDPTRQDYYVCLDYAQAYDLILALSAFKKELGFA